MLSQHGKVHGVKAPGSQSSPAPHVAARLGLQKPSGTSPLCFVASLPLLKGGRAMSISTTKLLSRRAEEAGEASTSPDDEPTGSADLGSSAREAAGQSQLRLAILAALVLLALGAAASGVGTSILEAVEEVIAGDVSGTGVALFVVVYAAATVLLFPASLLTLAAGALFGPLQGTAIVSLASTTGATLAFLVSRYVAKPLVEQKLSEYPKLQAVVRGISSQGLKLVLLLRLSPLFPFSLLNYALGVTTVGLGEYVLASWVGMLPGTFAYVFLGGAGRAAADAATGSMQPAQLALYAIGAAATLAVTKIAAGAASQALEEQQTDKGAST